MARLIQLTYGYVESVCSADGKPYQSSDFRSQYYDTPGLIIVFQSEYKNPGKCFAYFFPFEQNDMMQRYLRTSLGNLKQGEKDMTVSTNNSIYKFRLEENCLTEEQKRITQINAGEILLKGN